MVGKTVLHYRIIARIGSGGMGVVWSALDTHLDREVALKFLSEAATSDRDRRERFVREAKAASALNHPNIVTIHDINSDGDVYFIAMELVRGRALSQVLRDAGRLTPAQTLSYAIQLCDGLGKAHHTGIVHRDIKPSNIMVNDDGLIKILDFGLAKLTAPDSFDSADATQGLASPVTQVGAVMGTVQYMSPEQATGAPAAPRSDVFSTGILLYQMMGGRLPFEGGSRDKILKALIAEDPPPLRSLAADVPEDLARIIHKCLQKDPAARYRDAAELAADLRSVERHVSSPPDVSTVTLSSQIPVRPSGGKRIRLVACAVALFVVLAAVLVWQARRPSQPRGDPANSAPPAAPLVQARSYMQRFDVKGNVDRAIDTLRPAVQQYPSNAALHAALAEAYVRKYADTSDRQWLEKAQESGRRAVAANEDLAAAHVALGNALASAGKDDEALAQLERASDLDPLNGRAFLGMAKIRFARGGVEEAELLYRKAVNLVPGDWVPLAEMGAFYYKRAQYSQAIESLRQALLLAPDNVTVLRTLGAGYHMKGDYADAASSFQRALELDPAASTWANLGTARFFQGRYDDAVRAMKNAVDLAPKNYLYWRNLGDAYRWAPGQRSKADAAYGAAIQLAREKLNVNSNDTAARSILALCLAKTGDKAEALLETARIERAAGNDLGIVFKIAVIYELTGNRDKALSALDRVIRAGYSMLEVTNEPELASLRSDDRYRRIAAPDSSRK